MSNQTLLLPKQERNLIFLVAMVQFINILDFMMVMPLGPDMAKGLGISLSHVGLIAGSYTFAAAIAGLVAAPFLDQFSRKRAMLLSLGGVIVATMAGAFAWNLHSMIATRVLAGIFGGQMFALSQAVIADFIPPERRGAAMGKVAGGFAAASVIGLPFGLELAALFNWQAPFIATGIIGIGVWLFALAKLPDHAPFASPHPLKLRIKRLFAVLDSRLTVVSYGIMGGAMLSGFMIIPNVAAQFQTNLGYPRSGMGILYLCGGVLSFFGMRFAGKLMDRTSATFVCLLFTAPLVFAITAGFISFPTPVPPLLLFVLFMVGMSGRNICATTLSSKVPAPDERGAYMSLQSTITNLGSATGGYYASQMLTQENGALLNVPMVGISAVAVALCVPLAVAYVEHALAKRGT